MTRVTKTVLKCNDTRNTNRNDKRKPQSSNDNTATKQNVEAAVTTPKPQKERVQKPKEEKVAERRQRRNNRKKVRVNSDVKNNTHVENKNVDGTEVKAKAPENKAIETTHIVDTPTVEGLS